MPIPEYSDKDIDTICKLIQITSEMVGSLCLEKEIQFGCSGINDFGRSLDITSGDLNFLGNNTIFKLKMSKYRLKKHLKSKDYLQIIIYCLCIKEIPECQNLVFIDPMNQEICSINIDKLGGREYLKKAILQRHNSIWKTKFL